MEQPLWIVLIAAAAIGTCIVALIARFLFKLLKFVILAIIIAIIAGIAWSHFQPRPQQSPATLAKPSPKNTNKARRE